MTPQEQVIQSAHDYAETVSKQVESSAHAREVAHNSAVLAFLQGYREGIKYAQAELKRTAP